MFDFNKKAKESSILHELVEQFRINAEVVIVTSDEVTVDKADLKQFHEYFDVFDRIIQN